MALQAARACDAVEAPLEEADASCLFFRFGGEGVRERPRLPTWKDGRRIASSSQSCASHTSRQRPKSRLPVLTVRQTQRTQRNSKKVSDTQRNSEKARPFLAPEQRPLSREDQRRLCGYSNKERLPYHCVWPAPQRIARSEVARLFLGRRRRQDARLRVPELRETKGSFRNGTTPSASDSTTGATPPGLRKKISPPKEATNPTGKEADP